MDQSINEPVNVEQELPESLVHDIWRRGEFGLPLRTTDGLEVRIIDPGKHNTDQGPDFSAAIIQIGQITWAGDVEIHISSSIWIKHKHDEDERYNRVILHVALRADIWTGNLRRKNGSVIPEVVLDGHLRTPVRRLLFNFRQLTDAQLVCYDRWIEVPTEVSGAWVRKLARRRLFDKSLVLTTPLENSELTTADAFVETIQAEVFAVMGYAKNVEPMRQLFRLAHRFGILSSDDVACKLLGLANLFPEVGMAKHSDIVQRSRNYATTYARHSVTRDSWMFFRLRPKNFPPLRIAQTALLVGEDGPLSTHRFYNTLETVCDAPSVGSLITLFRVTPPTFWQTHVRLDRVCAQHDPTLGRSRIQKLLLNAVLPAALALALLAGDEVRVAKIFMHYARLSAESDKTTQAFPAAPRNALESQGLHELYSNYCSKARCLSCAVGSYLCAS